MAAEVSARIGGSFRDPAGYVFRRGERVFRALDGAALEAFGAFRASGLLDELGAAGQVVATQQVVEPRLLAELGAEHPGFAGFLEHEPLEALTFPYEWCVSMLADAGILTLDLQLRLLEHGLALKDASAFNVQFRRGRPVFIDLGSIERPARPDLWYASGQFGRMFTLPLLLARHRGWDLRSYFLGHIGGRDLEAVARGLGRLERWRPALLLDVTLPLLLGRIVERRGLSAAPPPRRDGAGAQTANLRRLRRKLERLAAGYRVSGVWADYTRTCTYDTTAETAKKSLVGEFLAAARPRRVLDAGCNTGDYSLLAARGGAQVLALDADHDAIELLYRRLRAEPADVVPIACSLSEPSPAVGFRNLEREPLLERVRADCVLALALMHHLAVTANLSFEAMRDLLWDLAGESVVLEFVPLADPQFERLLRFRQDRFGWVTLERCRDVFGERFTVLRETPIPGSPRTLLFLRKR